MTMTSSGFSEPLISPEMFQATAFGLTVEASFSLMRSGPFLARRSSCSASGTPRAADGTVETPSPKAVTPVCGTVESEVEIERISTATAPRLAASVGPARREMPAMP